MAVRHAAELEEEEEEEATPGSLSHIWRRHKAAAGFICLRVLHGDQVCNYCSYLV